MICYLNSILGPISKATPLALLLHAVVPCACGSWPFCPRLTHLRPAQTHTHTHTHTQMGPMQICQYYTSFRFWVQINYELLKSFCSNLKYVYINLRGPCVDISKRLGGWDWVNVVRAKNHGRYMVDRGRMSFGEFWRICSCSLIGVQLYIVLHL